MSKPVDFSQKQYFLFDMDGTLVDSMWLWNGFLKQFLAGYGRESDEEAEMKFDRLPLKESAKYIARRYGLHLSGEEVFARWTEEIEYQYGKKLILKRGAKTYLRYLKERGKRIALVTENYRNLAMECMRNNQVLELFDLLVCGDQMETDKSDPEYYRYALGQMGGKAEQAVLFEDTYRTLNTAKNVPLDTVIVEDRSARQDRQILMEEADGYITDFHHHILYESL